MKIIYDHKIFYLQKYGGISNYFINLCNKVKLSHDAKCALQNFDAKFQSVTSTGNSESGHKDVVLTYEFECQTPANLTKIEFGEAFEHFDELESIKVEAVINNKGLASTLNKSQDFISW